MTTERPKREGIMLCYPVDDGRISRLGDKFFVQPKLNGERCRIEWFCNEPVLMSSYSNVYRFLTHIQDEVVRLNDLASSIIGEDVELRWDGELYRHGWSWSQIRSVASREVNEHPDVVKLQYHIFDIQDETALQVNRFTLLTRLSEEFKSDIIQIVPIYVAGPGDWKNYASEFLTQGYEGIILRAALAPYHYKRNVCILKYKPTESDEYIIDEVLEAIDKYGTPKEMVGAFLVHGDDGTIFKVGAGKMKHPRRVELWQKRQKLTGLPIIVKHEPMRTVNEVPIAAVAVDVKGA
jgi:ATP-dependent DNA ligase